MKRLTGILAVIAGIALAGCASSDGMDDEMMDDEMSSDSMQSMGTDSMSDDSMDDEMMVHQMTVAITNTEGMMGAEPTPIAPGVWAVVEKGAPNPLFTGGRSDAGHGLEALAEDGNPSVLAGWLSAQPGIIASGVFTTPDGATGPAPAMPGDTYHFDVPAPPDSALYFATMYVQSNDLFFAPETGIALADMGGMLMEGDISEQIQLWDAGTEVNEPLGSGPNQAPRQAGPNTGPSENGTVHEVGGMEMGGMMYPAAKDLLQVIIHESMMGDM